MTQAQQPEALIAEYRKTMPPDVLHLWAQDACAELRRLHARVQELEARLEIDSRHSVDGIEARDCTIKLQDERIAELEAQLAAQRRVLVTEVQISAAAKELTKRLDYPWEYMTDEGRESMRENVRAVIEAAHGIAGSHA